LTPRIIGIAVGAVNRSYPDEYAPTEDHFDCCQQFVIEVALRLAEVNADLDPPPWLR
jgi:hypothetical protein